MVSGWSLQAILQRHPSCLYICIDPLHVCTFALIQHYYLMCDLKVAYARSVMQEEGMKKTQ
jgi:hypothetical protein